MTDTADDAENDVRTPRSRFAEALRPLGSLPYRLMWLGSTTSSLGDAVVQIGVLIAVFGTGWLFAFDAASFVVSVVCLAMLRVPARSLPPAGSFLANLAEGWHELAIRPWYWINGRPAPGDGRLPRRGAVRRLAAGVRRRLSISSDHFFDFLSVLTTLAPELSELFGPNR